MKKREKNNRKRLKRKMERKKTGFQTLLESVERRIFDYVAQIDQKLPRKKRHKRGRCCLRSHRPNKQARVANQNSA